MHGAGTLSRAAVRSSGPLSGVGSTLPIRRPAAKHVSPAINQAVPTHQRNLRGDRHTAQSLRFASMADAANVEPASSSAAAQPPQASGATAGDAAPPISPPQTDAAEAAATSGATLEPKPGHKRKVALFMAYVGAGYMVRHTGPCLCTRCAPCSTCFQHAFGSAVLGALWCSEWVRVVGPACAQGFQRNPDTKTLESDYHAAICKAGGISAENADDFNKVRSGIRSV